MENSFTSLLFYYKSMLFLLFLVTINVNKWNKLNLYLLPYINKKKKYIDFDIYRYILIYIDR